ncbi:hypothetical protein GCM10007913_01540 [Devosia yakushimensis]|uniref:Uncharacterized protein n=1 Tax=Devosia yakushimensis TaxID=470028 RepID=A0ABQ5U7V3_9HYPH|nr:hypothetical protein GCM10007913_01540 [Devosia yakushimensis]
MDSGLRRNDTVVGCAICGTRLNGAPQLISPTGASLGLDPRAALNAAQAASDPRVKPEEGDCGGGSTECKPFRREPADATYSAPITTLRVNSPVA